MSDDLKDVQGEEMVLQELMAKMDGTLTSLGDSDSQLVSVVDSLLIMTSQDWAFNTKVNHTRTQVNTTGLHYLFAFFTFYLIIYLTWFYLTYLLNLYVYLMNEST